MRRVKELGDGIYEIDGEQYFQVPDWTGEPSEFSEGLIKKIGGKKYMRAPWSGRVSPEVSEYLGNFFSSKRA